MTESLARAARMALFMALAGLLLGGAALSLGVVEGAIALWGFGAACLLQVPSSLSLRGRIRTGFGNSGLERERLTLRAVSFLLRLLALGMAMAGVSALLGDRAPHSGVAALGLALLAIGLLATSWYAKQGLKGVHPTYTLDADLTFVLLELAALLLVGNLLGRWFPWADAVSALAMALWLFVAGRTLAKATSLRAAASGCGGSCSCG